MTLFSSLGSHRKNANELAIFWAWPEIGIGEGSKKISGNPQCRSAEVFIYIYILEPVCPLFWGFNPPKQGPFQAKQPGQLGLDWDQKISNKSHAANAHVTCRVIRHPKKTKQCNNDFLCHFLLLRTSCGDFFLGVDLWGTSSYVVARNPRVFLDFFQGTLVSER